MNLFEVYKTYPVNIVKGGGRKVYDDKGNSYLDFYGGHAVISVGHGHPHYVQTLKDQLDEIGFYSNSVNLPIQEKVVSLLGEMSGYNDYNFFFVNSGAEAVENALKVASFYTNRSKVISLSNGFHGRTSLALAVTDIPGIQAPVNKTDIVNWGNLDDLNGILDLLSSQEYCAVIIEGIQGIGGVHIPQEEFLQKISAACKETGTQLILDEIQSGFGRSGKFFAHQYAGIQPDIITVAKGMGNGFPVGGVLIHPKIEAKYGMLGTTFGGNPLASAATLAVLEIIKDENLLQNAIAMGQVIMEELSDIEMLKIRGKGLMIGVDFPFAAADTRKSLLFDHGIFTGSATSKNTIRLLPALNVTESEVGIFINKFKEAIKVNA